MSGKIFQKSPLPGVAPAPAGAAATTQATAEHTARTVAATRLVEATAGLLCCWTFQEPAGAPIRALGRYHYALHEGAAPLQRVDGGVFGRHALRLGAGQWLIARRADCPGLDLHGPQAELSLVAWLRRESSSYKGCEAVAGMWNEHGLRQYALFLNLAIHDSAQQVGAHVSNHGGATPGYRYCMDAAIGATPVPLEQWCCVAMSYHAGEARAYLDGRLDVRLGRNPYSYPGGIFDAGPGGADFTVGAVHRPDAIDAQGNDIGSSVANSFCGLLAGLAIFDRALNAHEMLQLAQLTGIEQSVGMAPKGRGL